MPVFVTEFPPAENYTWAPVADGFERALLVTSANDDTGRRFVAEQSGQIWIIQDGARLPGPFLDLRERVFDEGYELGLLGLVFDPDFARNRTFFVKYTDATKKTITSRFRLSEDDPNKGDPDSENVLLRIPL